MTWYEIEAQGRIKTEVAEITGKGCLVRVMVMTEDPGFRFCTSMALQFVSGAVLADFGVTP
jgi:hypothetical protein